MTFKDIAQQISALTEEQQNMDASVIVCTNGCVRFSEVCDFVVERPEDEEAAYWRNKIRKQRKN